MGKKKILLKLTGTIFSAQEKKISAMSTVNALLAQLKQLQSTHSFGIVIGGGNFFRGAEQGAALGISPSIAHHVGMLATMMNGLILKDVCDQHGLASTVFSALSCPNIGKDPSPQEITSALQQDHILIFSGGTGNPFFTTDTNAVLRALEINADELWKGTNVEGIFDKNPQHNKDTRIISSISYKEALEKKLGIMDMTAFALAEQHNVTMRIFNIFCENALIKAAQDKNFGSIIT